MAVTGANGYVAAWAVRELLGAGYEVRACVRDPKDPAKTGFLAALAKDAGCEVRLSFARGDLLEAGSYDAAFAGCAAVVHAAAVVDLSGKDAARIVEPSVRGTHNVLESARKAGTVRRFVHISSVAAILDASAPSIKGCFTEEDFNRSSQPETGDPYGYAKRVAEEAVWEAAASSRFDAVVLNPSVVLGPVLCKAHTKASVVTVRNIVFRRANWTPYHVEFVDVRDVAAACRAALETRSGAGCRFILSSDAGLRLITDPANIVQKHFPELNVGSVMSYRVGAQLIVPLLRRLFSLPVIGSLVARVSQCNEFQRAYVARGGCAFSNARSKEVLGVEYRPYETTVRDSVDSMLNGGFIKVRPSL